MFASLLSSSLSLSRLFGFLLKKGLGLGDDDEKKKARGAECRVQTTGEVFTPSSGLVFSSCPRESVGIQHSDGQCEHILGLSDSFLKDCGDLLHVVLSVACE